MKTLHTFAFCDSQLSPQVIWYSVRVGISQIDRRAYRFVHSLVKNDNRYFFARHDLLVSAFMQRVADSLFPHKAAEGHASTLLLRQATIEVSTLARFLKKYPPFLLNSDKMAQPVTEREIILAGLATSAEIKLRKSLAMRKTTC